MSNHHLFLGLFAGVLLLNGCASTGPDQVADPTPVTAPTAAPQYSPEIPPLPGLNGAEAEAPLPLPTPVTSTTGS